MILVWLLGLVLMVVVFGLVVRAVVAILRVSLAVLAALAFTVVATSLFGLDPSTDPQSVTGVFLFSLLAALWLALRGRKGRGKAGELPSASLDDALMKAGGELSPVIRNEAGALDRLETAGKIRRWGGRRESGAAADRKSAVAWSILEQMGEGHRARIAVAKTGCERLLALAEAELLAPSALDALVGIQKGVPDLTEACVRHLMSVADRDGRLRIISHTIETLERIAARAEREADALARDRAAAFDLTRDHLHRRSGEDRLTI